MTLIPDEVIEQVRDTADIVALIGETVDLRRTGSDYRGPCPFHEGTHRNFTVIPRKGRFYCFVCKASGDVFSYFMKRFGLDYPAAVREVAQRCGMVIPESPGRTGPDPREPLFTALAASQDWFSRQLRELPEATAARDYLQSREFDLDELAPFDLGYAPRTAGYVEAMGELGIGEATLLEAGLLARRDDGRIVPRFRGRLLFPIHDLRGRVVGFGGRMLGPGEPKYLNSPETPVFHKGGLLYNLHQAKAAIRREESAVVVEGYFDVVRLALAGIENVVAPLGTALSRDHAALLRRLTPQVTLLFDSDGAGLRATFRAGDELLACGIRVRVATLPPGEDPDSLVRTGGVVALTPVLHDAMDLLERKLQILELRGWFRDVDRRREALDRLLPTLRATQDPISRELYLSLVAQRTGIDKKVLEREVENAPPKPLPVAPEQGRGGSPAGSSPDRDGARAEQQLLLLLLAGASWRERARDIVPAEWFESAEYREIYGALLGRRSEDPVALTETLSPAALPVWAELQASAAQLGGQQLDQIYEGACQTLEARPHFRALEALSQRMRVATPDEQTALADEKQRRLQELKDRYPQAWQQRSGWRRLRSGARRGGPRA